ncbi:hypothetical protein [Actinokineospora sp. NBRC 105648]|uniref:hypothetical protein n=1 Tax=Actinokineospora sp. NBRC 105648 TaxID=3032206 RepID=UPI0024A38C4D|nr:hypothetical protein [Actinokineospora sp. NBRC 105648]GLZ42465.1 hypothetical protein Acsp05_60890 [Actinokineospora sp. NBRC 105648]
MHDLELPGHRGTVIDLRPTCDCGWASEHRFPTPAAAEEDWWRTHALPTAEAEPPSWLLVKSDVLREQVQEMISTRPEAALKLLAEVDAWHRPLTHEAVAAARARGASWADIGAALGTTRQAAHERFRTLG